MLNRLTIKDEAGRFYPYLIVTVMVLHLFLAVGNAITKSPWSDEAWFANPAVNLITKGEMTTTVLETAGTNLKGLDQHTYWVMPLHLISQAAWYKIFGFSLLSMRVLSVVWGLIALASWFSITKALSGNQKVALLTFALLAFDYVFVMAASFGRMDMMSASLGFAGFAVYLHLRERNFTLAILISHSLIVASGLTHPNGGVLSLAGIIFLTIYFDRSRLGWRHLAVACVPYLIGAAGWGAYILQDPQLFISQFSANAGMAGRLQGLTSPLTALKNEITQRYLVAFGLGPHSAGHVGPIQLKIFILLTYVIAILCSLCVSSIRRHKGYRALFGLTLIYFVVMSLFDGQKLSFYLVHIVPMYTAILAVWIHWCWSTRFIPAWVTALAVGAFISLQVGGILYLMKLDSFHNRYLPAVEFLKRNADERSLVMGSAILGFKLGFSDRLVDDVRLGLYSGKKPDFIVLGDPYEEAFRDYKANQPEIYQHIDNLLRHEYKLVYERDFYQIYSR